MSEITFTQEQLEAFGTKLEGVMSAFSEAEQILLGTVVSMGIQALREESADVEGFLLPFIEQQPVYVATPQTGGGVLHIGTGQGPHVRLADQFAAWSKGR